MPSFVGAVIMYIRPTLINSPCTFHNPSLTQRHISDAFFFRQRDTRVQQFPPRFECIEAIRAGNDDSKYRVTYENPKEMRPKDRVCIEDEAA